MLINMLSSMNGKIMKLSQHGDVDKVLDAYLGATMFMSPNMEGDYTCSILYICGDIPLVSWLIWHVLAGAPCEGIKVPVKGLGSMMMHLY